MFLARLGHRVTAQDLSPVGLRCAQELARRHHVNLTTDCSDLASFAPEPASVDLVVAIWMQLPTPLRAQVHEQAIAALRPGGLLILEAYTRDQLGLGTGGRRRWRCWSILLICARSCPASSWHCSTSAAATSTRGPITKARAPWSRSWAANPENLALKALMRVKS